MKLLALLVAIALAVPALPSGGHCGTCSGGANCYACSNCNYCKHCSRHGGTCSVCDDSYNNPPPKKKPAKKSKAKPKPIQIPPDIAAKCDGPNQGEAFDKEFSRLAKGMKQPKPTVKAKPRGRPKKKSKE